MHFVIMKRNVGTITCTSSSTRLRSLFRTTPGSLIPTIKEDNNFLQSSSGKATIQKHFIQSSTTNNNTSNVSASVSTLQANRIDRLDWDHGPVLRRRVVGRPLFSHVQDGVGDVVAESVARMLPSRGTHLTTISHKAPVRLIPMPASSVAKAGAAVVVVSNYGGGLLPGDKLQYNITCRSRAKLAVTTQGSNRIYKQQQIKIDNDDEAPDIDKSSKSVMNITVEKDGLVVLAPDPVSVFTDAVYQQEQTIYIDPSSNICSIDWLSSGRYLSGERWQHRSLKTTTSVYIRNENFDNNNNNIPEPIVVDSINMLPSSYSSNETVWGMNGWSTSSHPWNAFATMLVYGEKMRDVIQKCQELQIELIEPHTRSRKETYLKNQSLDAENEGVDDNDSEKPKAELLSLSGRVIMGITEVPVDSVNYKSNNDSSSLFVIRFAAMSNEDLYRIFHSCLVPLKRELGIEFYKDRVRAVSCQRLTQNEKYGSINPYDKNTWRIVGNKDNFNDAKMKGRTEGAAAQSKSTLTQMVMMKEIDDCRNRNYWSAHLLADSALPTGSFAHSSGLEAAWQLGLVKTPEDVSLYVQTATKSALQQATPFVQLSHRLLSSLAHQDMLSEAQQHEFSTSWSLLDRHANARLVSNGPACRASLDQGRSLFRVASPWIKSSGNTSEFDTQLVDVILDIVSKTVNTSTSTGHLSTVLGIVTGLLGLNQEQACQLLGYCVARDMVSAAVRMNLVGPLASVVVLSKAQRAAEDGYQTTDVTALYNNMNSDNCALQNIDITKLTVLSSTCAPLLDSVQPCHDVLASRLFRT